ncbi:MAG: NAD(P)H-hydrate epimerase [Phycisphaerales bacterium]|nr:NAD(P)H-hydrate epimerase [Phycisphaerales bacterium]
MEPPPPVVLTRECARTLDQRATASFGIPSIVLMENACRQLAHVVLDRFEPRSVLVVAGTGNNGGDGYGAARHLHNAGVDVRLVGDPPTTPDATTNRRICEAMGLPIAPLAGLDDTCGPADVVIDALLGTGLSSPVREPQARAIEGMQALGVPIVAADLPSGLDADTGAVLGAAVRATMTVTFAGLKPAFFELGTQVFVGEIVLADIGAPTALLLEFGRVVRAESPREDDDLVELPSSARCPEPGRRPPTMEER